MKKILGIMSLLFLNSLQAQFKVDIEAPANFTPKEVYLYTLNGSKDILSSKELRKGNVWQIKVEKPYAGMLKLYFPETNAAINFISESKDVKLKFNVENNKITNIQYLDDANFTMNNLQDIQHKKEYILPALEQIKGYYKENTEFGNALRQEVLRLSKNTNDFSNFPFINFYNTNYTKYLGSNPAKKTITHDDIIDFFVKSNNMLETSSLMKPILIFYLNINPSTNVSTEVDKLLKAVNTETVRGQMVLSELIEIFDMYDMKDLKDKYLAEAKNLKCTINDRLSGTIESNENTEIGAIFPNYTFNKPTNTTAKSLHNVKATKKIIVFWSSTCSHCEAELPKILEKYTIMKTQEIEVVGFSLDTEKEAYENKVKNLPWINDTELKGWHSTFGEKYNIHATPTYFVLDANNKIIAKPDRVSDLISYLKLN